MGANPVHVHGHLCWAQIRGGGGCLLGSGRLPGIVPTHVYECMLVVCMSIISPPPPSPQVLNSISSSMDECGVNINDLISNLRMHGNSEKAVR